MRDDQSVGREPLKALWCVLYTPEIPEHMTIVSGNNGHLLLMI